MTSNIPFWPLENETVFVRADLNVPLSNGVIIDDFRLKSLQPTLDILIAKGARIIIGTHIGRPVKHEDALSTAHLLSWFRAKKYTCHFAKTMKEASEIISKVAPGTLLILENLRFHKEEKDQNTHFAQQLASLARYYVNDAFGLLHRNDTSITTVAMLYPKERKSIGLLVEKELAVLKNLQTTIKRPFMVFLGGGKVKDKLPLIEDILPFIDILVLCPAIVFTFLKSQGIQVGESLVDDSLLEEAKRILNLIIEKHIELIVPIDYQISSGANGPLSYISADEFAKNSIGITVGSKTLQLFDEIIKKAGTIFYNGAMGFQERPETMRSLHVLLQSIADSTSYSIIGGGESVAAVYTFGLDQSVSFCSTGGGATLAYLSHQSLPGLEALGH